MNRFEIAVIVFLAIMAAWGFIRGFVRTLIGMAMLVFSLVATVILSGSVAAVFEDSANVNAYLRGACETYLDDLCDKMAEGEIDVPLSEILTGQGELDAAMEAGGAQYVAELLRTEEIRVPVVRKMTSIAVNGIGAIATFALVRAAFFFIGLLIKGLFGSKKPGGFDRFMGMIFAVFRGILVVWLAMTVFRVFSFTEPGAGLMNMIAESEVLTWLDDHNLVLAVLVNVLTE